MNVRATRRSGEWGGRPGVRNFYSYLLSSLYFDYHHHRDISYDFVLYRFANEFASQ